ncbi:ABC transporter substrate-binding protein [Pontibaca methylaminivorans]|uniref:Peptide/nickel transport system substrate-binding protein n=1 Tax=Pontibaca methylaminivorans TaxID=515897 RepID=A0A1R3WF74_9RHOB|nr:ABC transporter substrate-binding protein [Pontibaca methylaminivorans]SIT76769.1 peptide/nickel transport system substrate-binding protein [Pontibaca methylaminivorans]
MAQPGPIHPAARMHAQELRAGRLGRREFLTRVTALGVSAAAALRFVGAASPAQANPAIRRGGTLRVAMTVRGLKDPRSYEWSEHGNLTRGILEYLVEYQRDGTFRPMLLDGWEVNADASRYVLRLRPDVRWSNGDRFTVQDVRRNIEGWCDQGIRTNSMAPRMKGLIDPGTGQARKGAIEIRDARTVVLNLSVPDVALIASLADFPAAITHAGYDEDAPFAEMIGTGPFRPLGITPGESCVIERGEHEWWGSAVFGGPFLDRVEFVDPGPDPADWVSAARDGEVDLLYETVSGFIDAMDAIGWTRTRARTAATIVLRGNQQAERDGIRPYADLRMRRALALAVDNAVLLELGQGNRGEIAANHHVSPIHPAYADIGGVPFAPGEARALAQAAGLAGFEHELITIDDDWQRNTGDAMAAQMQDAGLRVRRRILPDAAFRADWTRHPLSATAWGHRPLAVQVLALAYRSGAPWNESGYASEEFDHLLTRASAIADVDERRKVMAEIEFLLRRDAVMIQPYWRALFNHHAGRIKNAEMHPAHEIHLYRIGFAA